MRKRSIFDKKGLIPGEHLWGDDNPEDVDKNFSWMLNFYATNGSRADFKNDLILWMKTAKYKKADIDKIKTYFKLVDYTAFKAARMLNLGLPVDSKSGKNLIAFLKEAIDNVLFLEFDKDGTDKADETKAARISPLQRIENNVGETIIVELESMIDTWDKSSAPIIDLKMLIQENQIPVQGYRFIEAWIEKVRAELMQALIDPELAEGYSHLKKGGLNKWIRSLNKLSEILLDHGEAVKTFKKKQRQTTNKKRKPTALAIQKKVDRLKYMSEFEGLKSINPKKILGSNILYVYNTKYKLLSCYRAESRSGLDFKGTTLQNFAEDISFKQTVRKPDELIKLFKDEANITEKKVENLIQHYKTKKSTPNGRINDATILLAAL